jgi:carbon monoxide dehydrogenase subunit G
MARYVVTVESPKPRAEVFAYLSDFSTTQEWDPGVVKAERLDDGPVALGSRVHLVASFMGRESPLEYVVTELDPPARVTVRGENGAVVSLDTMTFEDSPSGGTRVTYDADLTLKGPLKLADPALKLVFKGIGDRAADGLRRALDAT